MSINTNRFRLSKAVNNKDYRIIWLKEEYPPYWDDGLILYPKYRKGYKNPKKQIMSYQKRMYKTWKYNRTTQWK